MYKLNFIAVVSIVAAVSLVVGMASPIAVAFAASHENMTVNIGNMTGGGNATSMAGNMTETESLPSANQTGCVPSYHNNYCV